MKILSIETSCDETGISIIEVKETKNPSFKVLADSLNSQIKIHAPYGGVFPALAKREHQKNLPILFERTLKKAKLEKSKNPFDLIAVTSGPGLEPALWAGIVFAKELSKKWNVPIIPVNHMEGHILSVFGKHQEKFKIDLPKNKFPILALLVSGGHTELVLFEKFPASTRTSLGGWKYKIIGETLDDAAGEAFDKVARMLELPYPGGPEISKLSEKERKESQTEARPDHKKSFNSYFSLPRPMLHSKNFDFSFSGLKTAVLYLIRDLKKENPKILDDIKIKQMIAKEFEDAVVETLVYKTKKAIEKYNIKTVIVAGGVSANKYLKKEMQKITKDKPASTSASLGGQTLYFPDKKLSGDNSVMIGIVGYLKFLGRNKKGVNPKNIKAEGGLRL